MKHSFVQYSTEFIAQPMKKIDNKVTEENMATMIELLCLFLLYI